MDMLLIAPEAAAAGRWGPEVWAAIAQAVLSALAILAAWKLQDRQHRLELVQRSGAIVELLLHAADISADAARLARISVEGSVYKSPDTVLLKAVREAIDAIPIHELPIPDLSTSVIFAKRAGRNLDANVDRALRMAEMNAPLQAADADLIIENHEDLCMAHRMAEEAAATYARRLWQMPNWMRKAVRHRSRRRARS